MAATTQLLIELHEVQDVVLVSAKQPSRSEASVPGSSLPAAVSRLISGSLHMLPRSAFDDTKGAEELERVATKESWSKVARSMRSSSAGLYLALGAAGALLQQLQQHGRSALLSHSVQVELVGTSAHLQIDAGACVHLTRAGVG